MRLAKGHLRTGTLDDDHDTAPAPLGCRAKLDRATATVYAMVSQQTSHYPCEQSFEIPAVFTPSTFYEEEQAKFSFVSYWPSATGRMKNRLLEFARVYRCVNYGLRSCATTLDNGLVL